MGISLQQLRQRVRLNLQEPDAAGRFSDDALNLFINDALAHIADLTDVLVEEAQSAVAEGTRSFTLPERTLGVKLVRWNGKQLVETTPQYLDELDPDWLDKQGMPTHYYTTTPNVVRLVYIPAEEGVVRIRYTRAPAPLIADEDESELPDFLTLLAPIYATYLAWDSDDRSDKGDRWLTRFEAELVRATQRLATRNTVPKGLRIRVDSARRYR